MYYELNLHAVYISLLWMFAIFLFPVIVIVFFKLSVLLSLILCEKIKRYSIEKAIEKGDIYPWYQPVVDSRNGLIVGCEVLARWKMNGRIVVPPCEFIPQIEEYGLIIPMTRNLISQAGIDLFSLREKLPEKFQVSFNIPVTQDGDDVLLRACRQFQKKLPSVNIIAEVTERERLEPINKIADRLSALRKISVRIALDDFGTGYAGLSTLSQLPVDIIKIDHSFISQLNEHMEDNESTSMADIVVYISSKLSLEVIGEGVETVYQSNWLKDHGVNLQQGFLFSPAIPASDFVHLLNRKNHPDNSIL